MVACFGRVSFMFTTELTALTVFFGAKYVSLGEGGVSALKSTRLTFLSFDMSNIESSS
jgi:hypothetical protein